MATGLFLKTPPPPPPKKKLEHVSIVQSRLKLFSDETTETLIHCVRTYDQIGLTSLQPSKCHENCMLDFSFLDFFSRL